MMKCTLAFLAIFSLLLLYNTVDGRKYPEEYWRTRGRNLRMRVPMRKAIEQKPKVILSMDELKYHKAGTDAAEMEEESVGISSEPIGSGGVGGGGGDGDPKEEEPLGTSSEPVGSGSGSGDPKAQTSLFFKYYGHKVPVN